MTCTAQDCADASQLRFNVWRAEPQTFTSLHYPHLPQHADGHQAQQRRLPITKATH